MLRKHIVIISDNSSMKDSLVESMSTFWVKSGYQVEIQSRIDIVSEAECGLLHYDATDIEPKFIDYISKFPSSINGNAITINKSLFSHHRINKNTDYEGEVIIKTKENYGGLPEILNKNYSEKKRKLYLRMSELITSHSIKSKMIESLLWRFTRVLDPSYYPIFNSTSDIPKGAWKNNRLLIEKYMPETLENGKYKLRHWYFFGDFEFSRNIESTNPIVKWSSMTDEEKTVSSEEWETIKVSKDDDIPDQLREVRDNLKLDFGRIDWAIHNGQAVIYDVNKTPYLSMNTGHDAKKKVIHEFSKGIEQFC